MSRQYAWEEATIRIYRALRGDYADPDVTEMDGSVTLNEALSGLAEILQESGLETLIFPGFASSGDIDAVGTITCEDLAVNDAISARTLDSTSMEAGTGTFYAGFGEVSIGGFNADELLGGGKIVLGIGPASTRPTGTLAHLGGVLFSENGNLLWLGASGTVSTLAGS